MTTQRPTTSFGYPVMLADEFSAQNIHHALIEYQAGRVAVIEVQPGTPEYLDDRGWVETEHRVMPVHSTHPYWQEEELRNPDDKFEGWPIVNSVLGPLAERRHLLLHLTTGGWAVGITAEELAELRARFAAQKAPAIASAQLTSEWSANPSLIPVGHAIQRRGSVTFVRLSHRAADKWVVTHSTLQEESYDDDPLSFPCSCPFSGRQHAHRETAFASVDEAAATYRRIK